MLVPRSAVPALILNDKAAMSIHPVAGTLARPLLYGRVL